MTIEEETGLTMKVAGGVIATIVAIGGALWVTWAVQGNDFILTKYFAPKYEEVRRQTFEESRSYNQGEIQELQNMQFAYSQADEPHRAALADIILHRAADYDLTRLPPDTRQFIQSLKDKRVSP
jgi:hypothetical protein